MAIGRIKIGFHSPEVLFDTRNSAVGATLSYQYKELFDFLPIQHGALKDIEETRSDWGKIQYQNSVKSLDVYLGEFCLRISDIGFMPNGALCGFLDLGKFVPFRYLAKEGAKTNNGLNIVPSVQISELSGFVPLTTASGDSKLEEVCNGPAHYFPGVYGHYNFGCGQKIEANAAVEIIGISRDELHLLVAKHSIKLKEYHQKYFEEARRLEENLEEK